MEGNSVLNSDPKIVQTDVNSKDGLNTCPLCGSTDISVNEKSGKLRCNFCRHEFEPEKVQGLETDIAELEGEIIGSGAKDIVENEDNTKNVITLKCTSCGAEVVIDTSEQSQARCHWCRNTLSVNHQVPNGSVPDVVLPFNLTKAEAKKQIENFVRKRKFFAHPQFKREFKVDNIMGVYFPYMVVDINSHACFSGRGESLVSSYTRGSGKNTTTYYDADEYRVKRDFDLVIEGLTVESSSDKLSKKSSNTNNIINSIMPFDIENSVKYNANYLKGYTSEKRDINVEQLRSLVDNQSKDIARFSINETLKQYDRGVSWEKEQLDVKGKQWKTAYLPVWLYSYQQKKSQTNSVLHYVAVNARTKETMGSVPIHMPKLVIVSFLLEVLAFILMKMWDFSYSWLLLLVGFIFFFMMHLRYRNSNVRHHHETETKKKVFNLMKTDDLIRREKGLTNSRILGENTNKVTGQSLSEVMFNSFTNGLK